MHDKNIWNEIIKGNKKILSGLFLEQYDDLFRYAMRFEKDGDTIKDLIQDLFANIWLNKSRLSNVDNIKAYLYKSIRNLIINQKVSNYNKIVKAELYENDFNFTEKDFFEEESNLTDKKSELVHTINELPPKQREVIYLKYFQGFDTGEIASILNQNNQSVRNSMHRAISKLRDKMLLEVFSASALTAINHI